MVVEEVVELLLPPIAVGCFAPPLLARGGGADSLLVASLLLLFPPYLHVTFAVLYTFLYLLIGFLFISAHPIRLCKAVTSWSRRACCAVLLPPI